MQWLVWAFLSLLAADAEHFQKLRREQENFYLPSQFVTLLGEKAVQQELKLNEAQAAEATKALQTLIDFDLAYREIKDQDQARKRAEQLQKETLVLGARIKGLLTKQQLRRANQIMWQGGREFAIGSDRELIAELELADSQVAKMDEIRAKLEADSQALMQTEPLPRDFPERLTGLRAAATAELQDILTPAQKAKYKELLGAPFDVSGLGR